MSAEPRPLSDGTLLADRFEVRSVLGRGAFGIVYVARDLQRNDLAVVKELAPGGCRRTSDGHVDLPEDSAPRLRQNFLQEAKMLASIRVPGILPVRAAFSENGTAYFATDYQPNAKTLEQVLREEGPLEVQGALDILYQCLEILEAVHTKGVLHRDLKPSNILLNSRGEATLIDFGAAREWQADSLSTHTVLFTPSYAPLEQMAERARRGPATDLYSLCATFYEMVTGRKPESATDRATGTGLTPILALRPEIEPAIAEAVERGLALKYSDRPQTVEEFRTLLARESPSDAPVGLLEMDAKMLRLQKFAFARRQCPACSGVLEEPKPLRRGTCPVCQAGPIKARSIDPGICPFCRQSPLKRHHNRNPVRTCPRCRSGWLSIKTKGLLSRDLSASCPQCHANFTREQLEESTGRSEWVRRCDACGAQLDEQADGRLLVQVASSKLPYRALYPEEWDCVAAGLEPGAGNAECQHCGADYYLEKDQATLLTAPTDPFGFAGAYLGRRLSLEDMRWLGVGKSSPEPGLVCEQCDSEFDLDGPYLRLIRTSHKRLISHLNEPNTLADWHRIAQDLPNVGDEEAFAEALKAEIVASYIERKIGFDDANAIQWKGPAVSDSGSGTLVVGDDEIRFGGLIRKQRWPLDALRDAEFDGVLRLTFRGGGEPVEFDVEPVELTASLRSGRYSVELTGAELAARLKPG